jgi:hypothetical protein
VGVSAHEKQAVGRMRFGLIAESLRTTADADENAGTGTAQASDKMLHLLQAQSAISLSLVRAQQADGVTEMKLISL